MDDNFINSLRAALGASGYTNSGAYDPKLVRDDEYLKNQEQIDRYNRIANSNNIRMQQLGQDVVIGDLGVTMPIAGGMIGTSVGGPLGGILGAELASFVPIMLEYEMSKRANVPNHERERALEKRDSLFQENLRRSKRDAVNQLLGSDQGVDMLAENGKIVLDDGSIEDIDYSYYGERARKGENLSDIFGTRGWAAVREEARRRGY